MDTTTPFILQPSRVGDTIAAGIRIELDQSMYSFGGNTIIRGKVLGLSTEDRALQIETVYGVSLSEDFSLEQDPEYSKKVLSSPVILKRDLGYGFEIPLEFPNVTSGKDSSGRNTYSFISNRIKISGVNALFFIPIDTSPITELRNLSRDTMSNIPNLSWQALGRYEEISIKEEKTRSPDSPKTQAPSIVRLPWNLDDTVSEAYYASIIQSSWMCQFAHFMYQQNRYQYLILSCIVFTIFTILYMEYMGSILLDSTVSYLEYALLIATLTQSLAQNILQRKVYPEQYFLRIRPDITLQSQKTNTPTLGTFLIEPQTFHNPISDTSGSITFIIELYYSFEYMKELFHNEHIAVFSLEKAFSSHHDLIMTPISIPHTLLELLRNAPKLEQIGIFVGFMAEVRYERFPNKIFFYKIGEFKG